MRVQVRHWFVCLLGWVAAGSAAGQQTPSLIEMKQGDHLCIIGNTLADRMQHDGWLETVLQARFPKHELVIRNLGFSGDELTLRLRSAGFGTPDEHLTFNKASVIFAFFGYNESFAGAEGLEKFKKDLRDFISHTQGQKYDGSAAPRLVLFSPIAHEDLKDRNLTDGKENNERLALYVDAMKQVADEASVPFVDLFHPTADLYARVREPLTINGVHLTELGNRYLATIIDSALFGPAADQGDEGLLEQIRQAVLEKNFHWFNRYRTVDGYSIYGGRADLRFVDGQTNREVMQREMEVLDVMTANRDRLVWARANRGDLKVDDSNTPPFLEVKTNRPGDGPNGEHLFLSGEESIARMKTADGMKVSLFASEEKFPELINPVQMSFDTKGRLWVATWPTYPHWKPKEKMNDLLLIVHDDDGDGKADRTTTFADGLHNPTGFEFWGGGVLVAMCPEILFLKDTDGDDRADVRISVLSGLDTADTHHASNSFTLDPWGGIYFQEGTFHHTQVESPYAPTERCANAGVFRYEPRTQRFEVYVSHPFANPHGHAFDRWGQDFVYDGTGSQPYHAALFSGRMEFPQKHATPPQVYQQRTRPCPGVEVLSSKHFPDELQGNLLVGNVIGIQGILQYKVSDKGASFSAEEGELVLRSTDINFRPSDLEVGPDGAIWFTDWHNPIIGHMQHNLRDPSRDRSHGRVYRITYEGRPLSKPPAIAGVPTAELLDRLKEPEARVRYRTRIELSGRPAEEVMKALDGWLAHLDPKDPDYEHHRLEGLWLKSNHNVVDETLLRQVLASPDFRARAAATRLVGYQRHQLPGALDLLRKQASDEHPRVRLEAVRAASFFKDGSAIEIPIVVGRMPTDEYLNFVMNETTKALEPYWKRALTEGRDIVKGDESAMRTLLKSVSTEELLQVKPSRAVYLELLSRKNVRDEVRTSAIERLSKLDGRDQWQILAETIARSDDPNAGVDESVLYDLGRILLAMPADQLKPHRAEIEKWAKSGQQGLTRQMALGALIAVDDSIDPAWELGQSSVTSLIDVIGSTPFVKDIVKRTELHGRIAPLLAGLPSALASANATKVGTTGRFVRVDLPGSKRALTLAEVEVISGGENVARKGKATQKDSAFEGWPQKGIDGTTSGSYSDGGQTHTDFGDDPWWEVDLGQEWPIETIAVFNRTDDKFGKRLDGFTLTVLDSQRQPVWRKENLPAPEPKSVFTMGVGKPEDLVRKAAMMALVKVPGKEPATFAAIAPFVVSGVDRPTALRALMAIPGNVWPKDAPGTLLPAVLKMLAELPVEQRTTPEALDAVQVGQTLAALLPADEAKGVRAKLRELGVNLIRVATVPDRMLYDKEVLAVEVGQPVEILFENTDIMPHNFVVTQPGALEEVGLEAEAMATSPSAIERNYVPPSTQILVASRLLQPRDAQRVRFTAPTKPGVYPYVCTYPGHWRRMYGAIYVVEDIESYLADPAGYLAAIKLDPVDPMLKFSRPRQEWKYDDLASSMADLGKARSFASGKQVFQVANCVACHRMNGVGYEIGPDLSKLDAKQTATDILRSLLEPSAKIDPKYATQILELESGKIVTGLLVEETADSVKLVENPLAKTEPMDIPKSEIAERQSSPTSAMPLGLADRLTREEILDLIAYLIARGDAKNEIFAGAHAGHGGH